MFWPDGKGLRYYAHISGGKEGTTNKTQIPTFLGLEPRSRCQRRPKRPKVRRLLLSEGMKLDCSAGSSAARVSIRVRSSSSVSCQWHPLHRELSPRVTLHSCHSRQEQAPRLLASSIPIRRRYNIHELAVSIQLCFLLFPVNFLLCSIHKSNIETQFGFLVPLTSTFRALLNHSSTFVTT